MTYSSVFGGLCRSRPTVARIGADKPCRHALTDSTDATEQTLRRTLSNSSLTVPGCSCNNGDAGDWYGVSVGTMTPETIHPAIAARLPKTVVLVGLMGAGKTSIGRRIAHRLHLPFLDADAEIEAAAGCTIEEIFARHGEAAFRAGERRVIARLILDNPVHVLATGGGAFVDEQTRMLLREHAITVWLRAELEVLLARTARRNNRPLLKTGDPREILANLIDVRYPVYAEADVILDSEDVSPDETADRLIEALERYCRTKLQSFPAPTPENPCYASGYR